MSEEEKTEHVLSKDCKCNPDVEDYTEKKRNKKLFYLVNLGDEAYVKKFESKKELNKYIETIGLVPHSNLAEAGQGLLEMPDGSKSCIIHGNIKILTNSIPKPVVTKFKVF
jgi:hypothetical protein